MRSPVAWHRLMALALAGLWALLPVAGALHDEDHPHRYCAEHGAVEEADLSAEFAARAPEGGLHADEAPGGDLHAACSFAFVHRLSDGASGARVAVCVVVAEGLPRMQPPCRDVEARGLAALARAPKGSPPAA